MTKFNQRYAIDGIDLDAIYNRNEYIVRAELKMILESEDYGLTTKDVQDVYALTLNDFPAHYIHTGTIVLFPKVQKQEVREKIYDNITFVQTRPKV